MGDGQRESRQGPEGLLAEMGPLAILGPCFCGYALLTLTAPPVGQQVIALSAAALWPTKSANTVMLAAVVPEAAVVNGWWERRDKDTQWF